MSHRHDFKLVDTLKRRYRCECGVLGHRLGSRVVPLACQKEIDGRKHCGKDAVHATGNRQHSRCADHVQQLPASSARHTAA